MPALTSCIFRNTDFTGAANCHSIQFGVGGWAWVTWTFSDRRASLARVRTDSEIVIPLTSTLDSPGNRGIVDGSLPGGVSRITGIRAGMIPYSATYLGPREPNRHPAWRVFVDFSFRVKIDLPWYCFAPSNDTRVTIHYYILVSLDSNGRLRANVDQWEWDRTESAGFCGGEVADRLNNSVPGGVGALQAALDSQLAAFARFTFSDLYFLPGDGRRSGRDDVDDVRTDAAIILIQ